MINEIKKGALKFITCDRCQIVVAQDTGKPDDVALISISVNAHLSIPKTFLGEIEHEILTVDANNGSVEKGVVIEKQTRLH